MKNLLLFACGLLSAGAAFADAAVADQAILKCRAQPDTARRLACYDAIPVGASPASAAAPVASAAPAAAAAAPAPVAAAAPAPAASLEQNFGLRPVVKKQKELEATSIRSSVVGRFDGWAPGTIFTLANGQVWKVTDDTDAVLPIMQNPNVEITRGLIGAYFLQVEGHVNTARVARVK
jgi:lipoprotein-anchoring transpeptidase ErfK/SrfK